MNVDKKFKFRDIKVNSTIEVDEAKMLNKYNLNKIFPEIKNEIIITNSKIKFDYENENFKIKALGDILLQKNIDSFSSNFEKKNEKVVFKNIFRIKKNPILIDFLNFEKNKKVESKIEINGFKNKKNQTVFNLISLNEGDSKILFKNINLDEKNKLKALDLIDLNYLDKDKQKNLLKVFKDNNNDYVVKGDYLNAEKLIDRILLNNNNNFNFIEDLTVNIGINKVRLDDKFVLSNFSGNLKFKNQNLSDGQLNGNFPNEKKMFFKVKTINKNKVTTLYIDHAKPIVKNYKFIKGFDEGVLDFNSTKNGNISNSTLKIYDFKLKELPTLTKILTLASLQGIADILSGEGIRFKEFEMNFKDINDTITISEIYAIGPAISILMDGYIEKNKLVSLRGTLVPATTINKVIGSIPILGKILVGSKTGEGVFGVSFKIKGSPKNLETTVNPIKTLTPRFITRTLENIKNSN